MTRKRIHRMTTGIAIGVAAVAIGAPAAAAYPDNPGNGDSYRAQWQAVQHSKSNAKKVKHLKHSALKHRGR
jgi:hypothetical protein